MIAFSRESAFLIPSVLMRFQLLHLFSFFATHEVCCKRAKKSALLSQNVRSRWNGWRGWSAGQVSYTHTQQFIRRLVSPFIFLHVLSSALFLFFNYPLPLLHISSFILLFCFVTYCATFVSQQPHSTTISLIGKCLKTPLLMVAQSPLFIK